MTPPFPTPTESDLQFFAEGRIDVEVQPRITVEREIFRRTVAVMLEAGYVLRLYEGEDWCGPHTTSASELEAQMQSTDTDTLVGFLPTPDDKLRRAASVFFVYGNSGWDVINDYSQTVEDILKPVNDYADGMSAHF